MVIDIITFNGEYDLFELRYQILRDYVDEFIVVEFDKTFSGNDKEPFGPRKDRFYDSLVNWPKVKYFLFTEDDYKDYEDLADSSPSVPKDQHWWKREFCQKECIKKALVHLPEDATCFVGDCDEIWNPEILALPFDLSQVYKLKQKVYAYYLNNRSSEDWSGTYVTSYKTIKNGCLNHLRTRHPWIYIQNGGWHFTNMGGPQEIRRKLESYGHQEFNNDAVKNNLEEALTNNTDFIGRDFRFWYDESGWPDYLITNKDKYIHLC